MVKRNFWLKKIRQAWQHRNIVWLAGVRRAGKTTLCQSLPNMEYYDCELPRTRYLLEDGEAFLEEHKNKTIVLDEIHRLHNPSELLKIAADHYPTIKIIATGSSTLGASAKFKDTLAGRKTAIWLTPMIDEELHDFGNKQLSHRLLHGGLPPFFISKTLPEKDFQEWVDAYWAKDIQELFRLEKRYSFQKFTELLLSQSGGIFEATRFTRDCEASRATISNYLSVLEQTYVVHIIRPFSRHKSSEIVSAPKVMGFDTGFVCHMRGWQQLRTEDMGLLWEHYVLNELQAHLQTRKIYYWRDKRGHEIDFILLKQQNIPIAIECKWKMQNFDPTHLEIFRRHYKEGDNYVVATDVPKKFTRTLKNLKVTFINISELSSLL